MAKKNPTGQLQLFTTTTPGVDYYYRTAYFVLPNRATIHRTAATMEGNRFYDLRDGWLMAPLRFQDICRWDD
jgi:hypothetical protein